MCIRDRHPARSADQDGHRDKTSWEPREQRLVTAAVSRELLPGLMSKNLTDTKAAIRLLWALGMK